MVKLKGFTVIELMVVVCIIGILYAIGYGAYHNSPRFSVQTVQTEENNNGRILNPDGTPVRPSNDQIGHYSNAEVTPEPIAADSIEELCIDGIIYILITKSGQNFMAPKEDTFGYNMKCSN